MNQIVYQPQDDNSKRNNNFKLTSEQWKHLLTMMPIGYTLISKSKSYSLPAKKKDNISYNAQQQKSFRGFKSEPQSDYNPEIILRPAAASRPPTPPKPIDQIIQELSPQMARSMRILLNLKSHPKCGVFLDPVDVTQITDYLDYVSEPIDLGTIEYNILNGAYQTFTQFMVDVKKMWYNAYSYNVKDTPIYYVTVEMDRYFDKLLKDQNVPIPTLQVLPPPIYRQNLSQIKAESKRRALQNYVANDIPLTLQEKRNIASMIKKLPPEYLKGVWSIMGGGNSNEEDNLDFDLESVPTRKARELEHFVRKSFSEMDAKYKHNPAYEGKEALENQLDSDQSSFIIDVDDSD